MNLPDAWEWINSNGVGLSAAATVLTAAVAMVALRQAANDSRARSRPMLVAEFRRAENSHSVIDLVVRNAGPSVARNVKVTFDPSPIVPPDTSTLVTPFLIKRYADVIPTLGPGQQLTNIWYTGDEQGNREPTPDEVTVTLTYRGTGRQRYRDEFPLHVDIVRMTTYSTSTDSIPGRIDGIHKSLQTLAQAAGPVVKAANYLRRDEVAAEQERVRDLAEQMRNARSTEVTQPPPASEARS
ncbi:hypothetical protein [Intrasporangium sp. DVR]|uniref:hypothetical protein n=1 Tax=Intrasporangium sp. DVR TaxID=3127867 RepID=UPI00313A62B4